MTVLFRIFMVLPHIIFLYIYQIGNAFMTLGQWFSIVFTGKRNKGLFEFSANYSKYLANVTSYMTLLHDKFPAFGADDPASPVRYEARYTEQANRLTTFFRYFTAIPAAIVMFLYMIAAEVLMIVSWFTIVITGRQPTGMFQFIRKAVRMAVAFQGYALLLTDEYPWPAVAAAEPSFGGGPSAPEETAPWKA
jgi:hypothetical protein